MNHDVKLADFVCYLISFGYSGLVEPMGPVGVGTDRTFGSDELFRRTLSAHFEISLHTPSAWLMIFLVLVKIKFHVK